MWSLLAATFISREQECAFIRHCNQMLSEMLKSKHESGSEHWAKTMSGRGTIRAHTRNCALQLIASILLQFPGILFGRKLYIIGWSSLTWHNLFRSRVLYIRLRMNRQWHVKSLSWGAKASPADIKLISPTWRSDSVHTNVKDNTSNVRGLV